MNSWENEFLKSCKCERGGILQGWRGVIELNFSIPTQSKIDRNVKNLFRGFLRLRANGKESDFYIFFRGSCVHLR